jgi:predicted GNAT family acetyltransferase
MDYENIEVIHNEAKQRYEARVGNYLSVLVYEREGNNMYYLHTEVPPPIEGHGIAQKLTHTALEDAKAQNLTIYPLCSFVVAYIRRHPEYISLLPEKEQARWQRG